MNMITTIISYPPMPKKTKKRGIKAKREAWAADGLCQQCGGEKPCGECGQRTSEWRKNKEQV